MSIAPVPVANVPVAPVLAVEGLCVTIGGRQVVADLSLEVGRGEILGLVGASGSGKSMTALAVMRLLPAGAHARGAIRLGGRPIDALPEEALRRIRGRDIGMIFQEPMSALNPLRRIGAQVAETVHLHERAHASDAWARARETLALVGLGGADLAGRYPHELSGGQRQRVAIAMAVILRPALLIADEPTTALDVITQAGVQALLTGLAHERRMALILVSHDLALIAQTTDRIVVMQDGAIVDRCRTDDVAGLRHPYARALLAAASPARKAPRPARPVPAGEAPPAVLQACGIVREYRRARRSLWRSGDLLRVVDGVTLAVHPGETVALVGESGSGKSTLLRVLLALERPQAGDVRLLGEEFSPAAGARQRRLRRSIQAVFQDPYGSFDPQWTVERLVAEPFHLVQGRMTAGERRRRVDAVLEQVGLSPADAARYSHEFSGGERQRIAIARALVTLPKVIVFDEAVSALDVLVRAQILDLLAALSARLELGCLFVSHDLNVVRAVADRIYVMQDGRIVEEGTAARVFDSPRHEYTRALLAATPRIGGGAP